MTGGSRKRQHESGGASSSWLLQCIEAIMKARHWNPFVGHDFVAFISEEAAAPVAEILTTRFARAYYYAGGFNIAQAGASTSSISLIDETEDERKRLWGLWLGWIEKKTPYLKNQEEELQTREEMQARKFRADVRADEEIARNVKRVLRATDDLFSSKEASEVMRAIDSLKDKFPEEYEIIMNAERIRKAKTDEMRDEGCFD
ncbi:hypothetical protein E8E11_004667 [Didymella keratinophila]|nr:hypothetical protein E8E11_004667 [Didymella keratinophila]